MNFDAPVSTLKGIGPRRAESLGALGLFSLHDLLYFMPRTYLDYSCVSAAAELADGTDAVVCVEITGTPSIARPRRGLSIVSVKAEDESGALRLVWYNQPYVKNALTTGRRVFAAGRAELTKGRKLMNPMLSDELPGILPVYPLTKGMTQKILRDSVRTALELARGCIEETLPAHLMEEYSLMPLSEALFALHFPENTGALERARHRLAFEDMLLYRLMLNSERERRRAARGVSFKTEGCKAGFTAGLPYAPTAAQSRIMDELDADMASPVPMNRLIQGDVGSGKTLLALYAMHIAVKNGYQAVFMAPTEILAEQHSKLMAELFGERAVLLTGGMKRAERERAYGLIAGGEAMAIVGTHALFSAPLEYKRLGLVITDEQHRFGVAQRAAISRKGAAPDVLIMSATPIPRTLALILYGGLDISVVDELPPGRRSIITRIVPDGRREDMYAYIEKRAALGAQAYAVCPLVSDSDELPGVMSAQRLYGELKARLGAGVGLLHGQMSAAQKDETMAAFKRGEVRVLVATSVVEVGVDVPAATVMVVENADRFGLAQLHQLRGRVGRGREQSYCFLLPGHSGGAAAERLDFLAKTEDGFLIAQKDLEMRGPGEFLGKRQHGLSEFAAASLAMDMTALEEARAAAERIFADAGLKKECGALIERARQRLSLKSESIAPN